MNNTGKNWTHSHIVEPIASDDFCYRLLPEWVEVGIMEDVKLAETLQKLRNLESNFYNLLDKDAWRLNEVYKIYLHEKNLFRDYLIETFDMPYTTSCIIANALIMGWYEQLFKNFGIDRGIPNNEDDFS